MHRDISEKFEFFAFHYYYVIHPQPPTYWCTFFGDLCPKKHAGINIDFVKIYITQNVLESNRITYWWPWVDFQNKCTHQASVWISFIRVQIMWKKSAFYAHPNLFHIFEYSTCGPWNSFIIICPATFPWFTEGTQHQYWYFRFITVEQNKIILSIIYARDIKLEIIL